MNGRMIVMGIIFVVAVGIVLVVIINADTIFNGGEDTDLKVENGDKVGFIYKIWVDENDDGDANDEWGGGDNETIALQDILNLTVYYVDGASNNTFSEAFVNRILGMKVGDNNNFALEPFTDEDSDGFDDITGEEVLGFRTYSVPKGKAIIISIEILSITKSE